MRYPGNSIGLWRSLLPPLIFGMLCAAGLRQANSELRGLITDQARAVIAGANTVLTDPATGMTKSAEIGSAGLYEVDGLNPAKYDLKVTANGFQSFVQNGIGINVSSTARVNVKLAVGAESHPEDTPLLIRDAGSAEIYALTLEEK